MERGGEEKDWVMKGEQGNKRDVGEVERNGMMERGEREREGWSEEGKRGIVPRCNIKGKSSSICVR